MEHNISVCISSLTWVTPNFFLVRNVMSSLYKQIEIVSGFTKGREKKGRKGRFKGRSKGRSKGRCKGRKGRLKRRSKG